MAQVKILFFANLRDRVGKRSLVLTVEENTTVGALKSLLVKEFPELAGMLDSVLVAINHEYAHDEMEIPAEAEVAFFPQVSGGASGPTICKITRDTLDLDELLAQITLPSTGAACIFSGMVRGITERENPHQTVYLEYEAYTPMAEAKMQQVAEEIRKKWPSVEGIAIVQRIGRLYPETPTVLIACTAAHRDTGVFEAARYGIDRLKEIVPIWKKEVMPDGEEWIEGTYRPRPGE